MPYSYYDQYLSTQITMTTVERIPCPDFVFMLQANTVTSSKTFLDYSLYGTSTIFGPLAESKLHCMMQSILLPNVSLVSIPMAHLERQFLLYVMMEEMPSQNFLYTLHA